jgi:excisionase family DNA binding protein
MVAGAWSWSVSPVSTKTLPRASDRTLPDPQTEPTSTTKRWAAILGVSERAVYYMVERGDLPAIRVGRRVVIPTARALTQLGLIEPSAT